MTRSTSPNTIFTNEDLTIICTYFILFADVQPTANAEAFKTLYAGISITSDGNTIIAAYQMIPNSQLSIIPNAPHPVFLVTFPAVWACIVPFLKN